MLSHVAFVPLTTLSRNTNTTHGPKSIYSNAGTYPRQALHTAGNKAIGFQARQPQLPYDTVKLLAPNQEPGATVENFHSVERDRLQCPRYRYQIE